MRQAAFQKLIWNFYKQNKRSFPWRETTNPYFIFLSEICLQQTQTSRVVEKYNQFIKTFPTVYDLSKAFFPDVLQVWSGLGYNRRAQYLHLSAKLIVSEYNGVFPNDPIKLDELPGVGINTACAIVVYAFNEPFVFIETNIRRVYIHHFFEDKTAISDQEILPIVQKTMDIKNPREWYWALMDYGSYLSKAVTNPNRKSKSYVKQSKFTGSVRQVRGSVLKVLLLEKRLTTQRLSELITGEKNHLEKALAQLEVEGFIKREGQEVLLRQ